MKQTLLFHFFVTILVSSVTFFAARQSTFLSLFCFLCKSFAICRLQGTRRHFRVYYELIQFPSHDTNLFSYIVYLTRQGRNALVTAHIPYIVQVNCSITVSCVSFNPEKPFCKDLYGNSTDTLHKMFKRSIFYNGAPSVIICP